MTAAGPRRDGGSPTPDGFVFRPATPADRPALLQLFRASFGKEFPPAYWAWFDEGCPDGRNRTTVAVDAATGRLAGSYSLLPLRLWLGSRVVPGSLCTNVNTHPDYQGRGLFTRLGAEALAREPAHGSLLSVGMPNLKALPGHMKVGWSVAFELPFLAKASPRRRPHACSEVDRFDDDLAPLLAGLRDRFSFLVLKSPAWLNWRLTQHPTRRYTCFVYRPGGRVRGYAAVKHFDAGSVRKSHIVDFHAEDPAAFGELVAACESAADGRDEINLWTNHNDPYAPAFQAAGYAPRPSDDRVILHANDGGAASPPAGNWSFVLADNDVY